MEKRSERNKALYDRVNKEISKKVQKKSNQDFESTNETLKSINPNLFGGEASSIKEEKPTMDPHKKKIFITTLVFIGLAILIVALAVVIFYGTKN